MARFVAHTDNKIHKVASRFVAHTDGKIHKVVSRWVVDTDGKYKKVWGGSTSDIVLQKSNVYHTSSADLRITTLPSELVIFLNQTQSYSDYIGFEITDYANKGGSNTIEFDYQLTTGSANLGLLTSMSQGTSLSATSAWTHKTISGSWSSSYAKFYIVIRLKSSYSEAPYMYLKNVKLNGKSVGFNITYP